MLGTIRLSPLDLRQIRSPHSVRPTELRQNTAAFKRVTKTVEKNWNSLSEEQKRVLRLRAYNFASPSGISLLDVLKGRFSLACCILLSGDYEAIILHLHAVNDFVESVLIAIEQENEVYGETIESSVRDILAGEYTESPMNAEQFNEWLTNVSDKAVSEVYN